MQSIVSGRRTSSTCCVTPSSPRSPPCELDDCEIEVSVHENDPPNSPPFWRLPPDYPAIGKQYDSWSWIRQLPTLSELDQAPYLPFFSSAGLTNDGCYLLNPLVAAVQDRAELKKNLIGDKEPISSLAEEFKLGSPVIQEKIKLLADQYIAFRRTRRDGNCFFRAFMFAYLEHICETNDKAEVDRFTAKLHRCMITLRSLGYIDSNFEDFFLQLFQQLDMVQVKHGFLIGCGKYLMLENCRVEQVSDQGVACLRFVAAGEIRRRAEFFAPFISGLSNTSVEEFCEASVVPMGEESEQVHVIALSDALGVPIRVVCLDGSQGESGDQSLNHHDTIPPPEPPAGEVAGCSGSENPLPPPPPPTGPFITLLYRPGHYDILYSRE